MIKLCIKNNNIIILFVITKDIFMCKIYLEYGILYIILYNYINNYFSYKKGV